MTRAEPNRPSGSNPFATRYIRPGSHDFTFPADASLELLLQRLQKLGGSGEIVGAHGSGKSTLIRSLIPAVTATGTHVTLFTLRSGMRRLPANDSDDVEWFPPVITEPPQADIPKLWIVDGAEQLSRFNLYRLRWACGWQRRGLVLTTHRPLGLPELWRTTTSPDLAWQLLSERLGPDQQLIARHEVAEIFSQVQGNLRELLLRLFDLYQTRNQHD